MCQTNGFNLTPDSRLETLEELRHDSKISSTLTREQAWKHLTRFHVVSTTRGAHLALGVEGKENEAEHEDLFSALFKYFHPTENNS